MAIFKRDSHQNDLESVENSAKTLLANIRFMGVDRPIRSMVITSAIPNEGKTFVASNLANAIATSGKTVLLVECDMRRRSLSGALGIHPEHGLHSVISGEVPLMQAAVPTRTPRMYFLDAEPHIPNPSDLISSRHFSQLIEEITKTFSYVIFDTPPVGTFVDAAVLGAKVDATFLVVRENFTHRDEVARAADQLQKGGGSLAGVIMNFCEPQSSEYYYEYYYHEDADGGHRRHHSRRHDTVDVTFPAPEESSQGGAREGEADEADAAEGSVSQPQTGWANSDAASSTGADLAQGAQGTVPAVPFVSSRPNDDMSRYKRRTR